jgi:hypothetical protein
VEMLGNEERGKSSYSNIVFATNDHKVIVCEKDSCGKTVNLSSCSGNNHATKTCGRVAVQMPIVLTPLQREVDLGS